MQRPSAINGSETIWRALYSLVLILGRPFVMLRLRLRGRKEPGYRERIAERLGYVDHLKGSRPLWIHAVSAGETIAAVPLIERLLALYPDVPLLVTTMTPAGSGEVKRRLGERVSHCYLPYDFADAVQRFFERVQPRGLILVETELWPNLLRAASEAGIPVALVNGRLSARSAKGYGRIAPLTRGMLGSMDVIGCQSDAHRERFIALGAPADRVHALGSVKYDVRLTDAQRGAALKQRESFGWVDHPVFIAASTHPGEEEQVLESWSRIRQAIPDARLLLVPRHPVRAGDVLDRVTKSGLLGQRLSLLEGAAPEVVIGDTMGSLLTFYGAADVAFVGGSLVAHGGHNPIEPALWGVPVVTGPHTMNFEDVVADFRGARAIVEVANPEGLTDTIIEWFGAREAAKAVGARGQALVDQKRGALERTLRALEPVLSLLRQ